MASNDNTNLNNLGDNIPRRRPTITTYDLNNDSKTQNTANTVNTGRMPNITTGTVTGSNSPDIKEIDIKFSRRSLKFKLFLKMIHLLCLMLLLSVRKRALASVLMM